MNKYDQLFNEKLGELMKGVEYPAENIAPNFEMFVTTALIEYTELNLDCSLKEYDAVYKSVVSSTWFMPEMFIALNAVKALSVAKCGSLSIDEWIAQKTRYNQMSKIWDELSAPYIKQAQEYVQKQAQSDIEKEKAMSGFKPKKKLITLS